MTADRGRDRCQDIPDSSPPPMTMRRMAGYIALNLTIMALFCVGWVTFWTGVLHAR